MKLATKQQPFLKWPGGKRWLAPTVAALFRQDQRYLEPFLGAGAVFFALRPKEAVLSDVNRDLICAFTAVRDHPLALIRRLSKLRIGKRVYQALRAASPETTLDRALRFIYLNRTAFNGIFRVNQLGEFNVPFGCKPGTTACDEERIHGCSRVLQGVSLRAADFREMLEQARATDSLYIDPPYTVRHDNNGFRRYNEQIFSWSDQLELARMLNRLAASGTEIVISNASHAEITGLYARRNFTVVEMQRSSCMAADASYRGRCKELIFISRSITQSRDLKTFFQGTTPRARILE